ncbi:transposase [Conexibacter woesei]|uniref:transposase n=1 Tax=Conexibacter woesei TaxID=191495 RepID=UPI0011D277A7
MRRTDQQSAEESSVTGALLARHEARERLGDVVARRDGPAAKVPRLLEAAEDDLLGFYEFPREHWPKLRSTNPLERLTAGRTSSGSTPRRGADRPRRHGAARATRGMVGRPPSRRRRCAWS